VGSESFLLANMRNGGAGTISATANVNPAAIYELYVECIRNQTSDIGDQTSNIEHQRSKMERQQADLNVVREVFGNRRFPSMIAALKQAIAIYANDPEWTRVRPPLAALTTGEAKLLAADLKAIDFAMPGVDCSRGR
jgi:4-hydroxy-tetrahydrodipicolinate synthase